MIKRLATYEGANETIKDVIDALKNKEYIFWGNDIACDCDYLFVHSQGESTIRGILKVRRIEDRQDITEEDFSSHRPKGWGLKLEFSRYFLIDGAQNVSISLEELKDSEGKPKKSNAMREMSFVDWDGFQPF